MYTLHPRIDDTGFHLVDVRAENGEAIFVSDRATDERTALAEAQSWADWAEHVAEGTRESIYYILSVPETWAGPPPGAHSYSGLHFKIGRSKDVMRRIQNLQTGASGDLIIHALEPGYAEREGQLHVQFEEERRSGEWFSASPQLMRHVFQTWKRNRMLPPEHQSKVVQLFDRIGVYKLMRQALGGAPDMVNPSLNEEWHGSVFVDLVYTKLLAGGGRES
jgi:hypothetical protein